MSADLDFVERTIVFACAMIFATCYTTFDAMVSFAITCHNKNRPNFIFWDYPFVFLTVIQLNIH